jgi:hypothetical protein
MAKGGASNKRNTEHHCPRAHIGGSNCSKVIMHSYIVCEVHQWQCPELPEQRPLLNQVCRICDMKDRVIPEKEAARELREKIESTNKKISRHNAKK